MQNRASTRDRRKRFLAALAQTGNASIAAESAGVCRKHMYALRRDDPAFAAEWDAAIERSIEQLEHVARERAMAQSDTLLIFLLKAHRPHMYRDRFEVQQTGEVTIRVVYDDGAERNSG